MTAKKPNSILEDLANNTDSLIEQRQMFIDEQKKKEIINDMPVKKIKKEKKLYLDGDSKVPEQYFNEGYTFVKLPWTLQKKIKLFAVSNDIDTQILVATAVFEYLQKHKIANEV